MSARIYALAGIFAYLRSRSLLAIIFIKFIAITFIHHQLVILFYVVMYYLVGKLKVEKKNENTGQLS